MTNYKVKTSLLKCLLHPPDGRTTTGLSHNIDVLCSHLETRTEGLELRDHRTAVLVTPCLRPTAMMNTSDQDYEDAVSIITPRLASKDWPLENRLAALGRFITKYVNDGNYKQLVESCDPTTIIQFNAMTPTVGGFQDYDELQRFKCASRILFKEVVVGMISRGAVHMDQTMMVIQQIVKRFGSFDAFSMSETAVDYLTGWKLACEFLIMIIDISTGATFADCSSNANKQSWLKCFNHMFKHV